MLVIAPPLTSPIQCCPVLRAPSRHWLDSYKVISATCHLRMCSMPLCAGPISRVPFVLLSLRAQLPLLLGRGKEGTRALQELLQYCQDKAGAQHAPGESSAPEGEPSSFNVQIEGHHQHHIESLAAILGASDAWLPLDIAAAQKHTLSRTCVMVLQYPQLCEAIVEGWQPCQASKLPGLLAGTGSGVEVNAKALWARREESVVGTLVRHHIRY